MLFLCSGLARNLERVFEMFSMCLCFLFFSFRALFPRTERSSALLFHMCTYPLFIRMQGTKQFLKKNSLWEFDFPYVEVHLSQGVRLSEWGFVNRFSYFYGSFLIIISDWGIMNPNPPAYANVLMFRHIRICSCLSWSDATLTGNVS